MARVLPPHASIGRLEIGESSKPASNDVFDSPTVMASTQETGSTRGMARATGPVDTTARCQNETNEGRAYESNGKTLISAWRRSRGDGTYESPIEKAKARLASWYVSFR